MNKTQKYRTIFRIGINDNFILALLWKVISLLQTERIESILQSANSTWAEFVILMQLVLLQSGVCLVRIRGRRNFVNKILLSQS